MMPDFVSNTIHIIASIDWSSDSQWLLVIAAFIFNAGVIYAAFRNTVTKLDLRNAIDELKEWSDNRYQPRDRCDDLHEGIKERIGELRGEIRRDRLTDKAAETG